jgi:hypothetical protein
MCAASPISLARAGNRNVAKSQAEATFEFVVKGGIIERDDARRLGRPLRPDDRRAVSF